MKIRLIAIGMILLVSGCKDTPVPDARIKSMDSAVISAMAKTIEAGVKPVLSDGLTLSLWAVDSLVADPVSIDIDDQGRIYYTRTNRQKNSEFDIRGHQDWEIGSISLLTIEDKRKFLHTVLAPENSAKNDWLTDVNKDGSRDWKDMTVEKEHVYRVEDKNGDGRADQSQLVVEDFNDEVTDAAGGVLKYGEDLFVGIGPDLWRIQENKIGIAAAKTSISHGYGVHIGFGGHGMSGLEVGPEGKIYWQIGDIGFNGKSPDGKTWSHSNSGVIVRSNPDGSDFEVFAYGNRNTHEFVFDEYGNLISEDNDGDHPGESERIVYVVNGADIGWRTNWQFGKYNDPDNNTYKVWMDEKMAIPRWEGQPAYILPTIKNFVNGPTGMLYNPGTALGPEFRNSFFVAEFVGNPVGSGIHSFRLKPNGASFEFVDSKKILGGVLATGIDFGPDGALYLGDWIDGWNTKDYGRIWKLDVNNPDKVQRASTEKHLRANTREYTDSELRDLLAHADMRVRQKAQFELAGRGEKGLAVLKSVLADPAHQLARVHAIWGISQFARREIKHAALLVPYLKDNDPEIRAQSAKWIGDVRYIEAGASLLPLLKDAAPRARFFAAEALGRIAYEPAVQPIIEMLAANNDTDNYLRHAGSLALARIGKAAPVIALSAHPSRALRIAAVVALRRMQEPGIRIFLRDADAFVVTEAARAINDDASIPEALPDLARILSDHRFHNEALIRRAISANLRVGTTENVDLLTSYIQFAGAPVAMRVEAMDALSTWTRPSVLDRVDGRFRGAIKRDPVPVQQRAGSVLAAMLGAKDAMFRKHAAMALGKLQVTDAQDALMESFRKDASAEVRTAALQSLAKISSKHMDVALKLAIADRDKIVRVAGLDLLKSSSLSKETMVGLLNDVIQKRTPEEKQAAITALGGLPLSFTEKAFNDLLDKWAGGKLPTEVQFELTDAIDSSGSAALKSRYKLIAGKSSKDSLKSAYAGALSGGDPKKGESIFWSNSSAQCVRCHAINDYGGNVGPQLNGVAGRLTRDQLLEALIAPSARIATGFGTTVSSMPPMHLLLSKKEIRDVVSFLGTLK